VGQSAGKEVVSGPTARRVKPLAALLVIRKTPLLGLYRIERLFEMKEPPALVTTSPPVVNKVFAAVRYPVESTLNLSAPFNPRSKRLPVNPEAAFTARPVPAVFQKADVAPAGSISTYGFVVVAVPPVAIHVPVAVTPEADSAPFTDVLRTPVRAKDVPVPAFKTGEVRVLLVKVSVLARVAAVPLVAGPVNVPAPAVNPVTALAVPVRLPMNVPVVFPGNVGLVGILRVHDPELVFGLVPVTVIWLAVPTNPTLVTVPELGVTKAN